jgi:hypothetical protein
VPEVTQDDYMGILEQTNACLQEAQQSFHLIIDNRIIKSEQVVSLDVILQSNPQLQQSTLRWVIMILPDFLRDTAVDRDVQQIGDVQLKYVDSLATAMNTLRMLDASLDWESRISDFFAEDAHEV